MSRDFDPPTHPVLRALHERIYELFPFGLGNIWMSLSGDTYNHMATTLGYSISDLDDMISATPLINGRGVVYNDFEKHLLVKCDSRDFNPKHHDGKTRREKWVRFVPPYGSGYENNETYMPYSDEAIIFVKNYFRSLKELGKQKCHRLTSSLKEYIDQNTRNLCNDKGNDSEVENEVDSEFEEDSDHTMELEASSESTESPGHTVFLASMLRIREKLC